MDRHQSFVCVSAVVSEQHSARGSVVLFGGFGGGRSDCMAWTPPSPCDLGSAVLCVSHQVGQC